MTPVIAVVINNSSNSINGTGGHVMGRPSSS